MLCIKLQLVRSRHTVYRECEPFLLTSWTSEVLRTLRHCTVQRDSNKTVDVTRHRVSRVVILLKIWSVEELEALLHGNNAGDVMRHCVPLAVLNWLKILSVEELGALLTSKKAGDVCVPWAIFVNYLLRNLSHYCTGTKPGKCHAFLGTVSRSC